MFNPAPGGGTSSPFTFTVTPAVNAAPLLTSLSPSPIYSGSATLTLTANGSQFVSASEIMLNQGNTSTTFISASQLQTDVDWFMLTYPVQIQVDVFTFPPGGGTSSTLPLPIVPGGMPVGTIDIVSVATDGTLSDRESRHPAVTPDGRFIAFDSLGVNLVPGGTNGHVHIFVRDTCFGVASGCSPTTTLVSAAADASEANNDSYSPTISSNGRFVAFQSAATNLAASASNGVGQVFLHDRDVAQTGVFDQPGNTANILISVAMDGTPGDMGAVDASINADGRFVAFDSSSDDLVPNDTNMAPDVFVRDTCLTAPPGCVPVTIRASVATDGTEANQTSYSALPTLSSNGRFVSFDSTASTLAPGFSQGGVFVRDTCFSAPPGCTPSTQGVSFSAAGVPSFGAFNSISADGRFVAFVSGDLVPGDPPQAQNVYVRDTCQGQPQTCTPTTSNVSVGTGGAEPNDSSYVPAIGPDGRFEVFDSSATNLAANNAHDTNGQPDYLVHDTCFGAPAGCVPATFQVSMANDGTQSQGNQGIDSGSNIRVSAGGKVVVFSSAAVNLMPSPSTTTHIYRVVTNFP